MSRIEESVQINKPSDRVFGYVTDLTNLPKWETNILEAERTHDEETGVGIKYRGVSKTMGQRMAWESEVTTTNPPESWEETITSGSSVIKERLTFESIEGGTKFTLVYDMQAGGFLKLLAPMVTSSMRKQVKENLANLKKILEAQT